jgi:acetyl esterase/lipase
MGGMFAVLASALVLSLGVAEVKTDVTYKTVGGRDLKLDLYLPAKPAAEPVPCVVVIHGGAWMSGKREDMAGFCQGLAAQGLAAATVQYRLAPSDRWPAMIEDCADAVRFLRKGSAGYGLDPARFGAAGASAGAHLSLLLAFKEGWADGPSSRVSVVLNLFGPTDLGQDFTEGLRNMVSQAVVGKPYAEAGAEIKALSPVTYVAKGVPPVFTIHGDKDSVVPVRQATRLDEAMQAVGAKHEMRIIPGMGHAAEMTRPEFTAALSEAVVFVKDALLKK